MIPYNDNDKISIGVSSCLLGEEVRYDGGHKYNSTIVLGLGEQFEFLSFCPEVEIGLGIPREPIHLVVIGDQTRCLDVITNTIDVTDRLIGCADEQRDWQREISGYILKKRSPSCGIREVKLWRDGKDEATGVGIYAGRVMQNFPELPVVDEESLEDHMMRDEFVRKVCAYSRWRQCVVPGS